jgi:hypothetical protein
MRVPFPAARMMAAGRALSDVFVSSTTGVCHAPVHLPSGPIAGQPTELADQDSNLDKQNQNLSCYRYTIGQ